METPPPDALTASTTVSSSASGSWFVCSRTVSLISCVTALPVVFAGKVRVAVPGFRLTSASSAVAPSPVGSTSTVTVTGMADAVPSGTLALRVTVIVALSPSVTGSGFTSTFRPLPSNVLSGVSCAAASPLPRAKTMASNVAHFELPRLLFTNPILQVSAPAPRTCTPFHILVVVAAAKDEHGSRRAGRQAVAVERAVRD